MGDISLQDLALALAISGGVAHPYGHVRAGEEVGTPVDVDYKNRIEHWKEPTNWRAGAQVHAGGFEAQDSLARALGEEYRKVAGGYKLGYLSGLTLPKGSTGKKVRGDIGAIEDLTGNKHYSSMLLVDALSDLFFDNKKRSINTKVTESGVPVMTYDWEF